MFFDYCFPLKHMYAFQKVVMKRKIFPFAVLISTVLPMLAQPVASQTYDRVIHVDVDHPAASDQNPGTLERPLRSLGVAVARALEHKRNNLTTRVAVHAGVYREGNITFSGASNTTPLLIEAAGDGPVIISGSDIWNSWTSTGDGRYTHPWPYDWGSVDNPWDGNVEIGELARRREMIFLNGTLLRQVLSHAELTKGSFLVDEAANLAYIYPPTGTNMATATVEVALRDELFYLHGISHVTLRGLTFQHAASTLGPPYQRQALRINNARQVIVEDCDFYWNNWKGLGATSTTGLRLKQVRANYNGGDGMSGYSLTDLWVEQSETSYNNWRGAMGGFMRWSVGQKFLRLRNATFQQFTSSHNSSSGLWFDADNENVLLDRLVIHNNRAGLKVEATQGPITIQNSTIYSNRLGLSGAETENLTLVNNRIYDNEFQQVLISGKSGGRVETNRVTGQQMTLYNRAWTIRNNIILGGTTLFHNHLADGDWSQFKRTLTADRNTYYHPSNERVFVGQTFSQWQAETGQEAQSIFTRTNPLFDEKSSQDIYLRKGWNLISSWIDPDETQMEILLASVLDDLILLRDPAGHTLVPQFDINDVRDWDPYKAYGLYMRADAVLTVTGQAIAPETSTIALSAGWNLVPYLCNEPITAREVLASIASELVVVKDNAGRVYIPKFSIDEIGDLEPGQGYMVYVDQPATLTFPAPIQTASVLKTAPVSR